MSVSSIPKDNIIKGSFLHVLVFQQRISITDICAIESITHSFRMIYDFSDVFLTIFD